MAVATIIATTGPGILPKNRHILVRDDGSFEGRLLGEACDRRIRAVARSIAGAGCFQLLSYPTCSGQRKEGRDAVESWVDVMIQPVVDRCFSPDLFELIQDACDLAQVLVLATDRVTGRTSRLFDRTAYLTCYHPSAATGVVTIQHKQVAQ